MRRWIRRFFLAAAGLLLLGAAGCATLLVALRVEHNTPLTLPAPTGPFAVGRITEAWADPSAVDLLAPAPETRRELLVWVWYPAAAPTTAVVDDYVPARPRMRDTGEPAKRSWFGTLMGGFLTRDVGKVRGHSLRDVPVSPQQSSYPVAILRAAASSEVSNYSTLAEDLASHGYVVVGLDAPYRTGRVVFPDGRVAERTDANNPELLLERNDIDRVKKIFSAWTSDMAFVVDRLERLNVSDRSGRFTGRLDLSRVGAFGHSFGGAQAAQFCHDDRRCRAGIDIDGAPFGSVVQEGVGRPFMFLLSSQGDFSSDADNRQIESAVESMYARLPADGRVRASIRGAFHFTFTDDGALFKSRLIRGLLRVFGRLKIDGRRQLEVTAYCVRTFFDAYLKGIGTRPPTLTSTQFPEVVQR